MEGTFQTPPQPTVNTEEFALTTHPTLDNIGFLSRYPNPVTRYTI